MNNTPAPTARRPAKKHDHDWSHFVSEYGDAQTWKCACGDELVCYSWER